MDYGTSPQIYLSPSDLEGFEKIRLELESKPELDGLILKTEL